LSDEKIHIIGIGDDGLEGLTSQARTLVEEADLLIGEEAVLPKNSDAETLVLRGSLDAAIERIMTNQSGRIVVLASGDPLFYGVARYLFERVGEERFEVLPHVSSMQLAFARVKQSWEEAYLTNLANHQLESVVEKIRVMDKIGLFTTDEIPPADVARALLERDIDYFSAYVCENLAGPDERVTSMDLSELADQQFAPLNVMILVRKPNAPDRPRELVGQRLFGNPDDAFVQSQPKQGLLTPSEVRAMALAELDVGPGSIVWDVGAGSGSVAIEAAAIAPQGTAYAIEMDLGDHELIKANTEKFGRTNLVPILGQAPAAWHDLPDPDCIFVGGTGREVRHLVELAYDRLKPGGRLVANVASIENLAETLEVLQSTEGEVHCRMVNIARGTYQMERIRFDALNPCFLLSVTKPA
jgi:precorrin-6Y C5,15-methyltransferase (decarboxylating)